ncbi:ArsR/SmtB family transcription factor [Oricola sp.]|uniref:ArsR/SmtB family transcription factor n=1 Tax=Oricola sp. TaxID=1979950 RepID=UPI003BAA1D42
MDKSDAIASLGALAQETRLDTFRLLVKRGEVGMAAGEIAEVLDVRQNTMSANLAVLARAGLVRSEREGRVIRYFADFDGMRDLLGFLMEDCCGGNPELCQPVLDELVCAC